MRSQHLWIVLFISGFTGLNLSRCKSYQIPEKIIRQEIENEEATQIAQRYIPAGKDQQKVVGALKNSSELLREAEKETQKAQAAEKAAESDAKKFRWIKGIAIAAGIALAVFGGFKAFRAISPI